MSTFTIALWADESLTVECEGDLPLVLVDGEEVPTEMVAHCLAFGMRQLIRDAGAISKADAIKPDADAVRNALARKKLERLIAGTLREGVGGKRLDEMERAIRAIVERELGVWAKTKGKALPSKQAELEPLRAKWLLAHGERIERQAVEELQRLNEMAAIDIDFEL